jgi:hypothetical protein
MTTQYAADYFYFLRDHFESAALHFCEAVAKGIAPWADVWDSKALDRALLEIAADISREDAMDEDAMNNFVDARLQKIPWVEIAVSVAPLNPRDYRIIGATTDEQEFNRRYGVALDNPHSLRPVAVHNAQAAAYRKDRYIAYDLSVSAYMRASGVRLYAEGRKVTATEWLEGFVGRPHGY